MFDEFNENLEKLITHYLLTNSFIRQDNLFEMHNRKGNN